MLQSTHAAVPASPSNTNTDAPQQRGQPGAQDRALPLKAIAAATALVVMLLALRTSLERAAAREGAPPNETGAPGGDQGASTLQAAREEWEAMAPEDWWKAKLAQKEAEEAALDFWSSSRL